MIDKKKKKIWEQALLIWIVAQKGNFLRLQVLVCNRDAPQMEGDASQITSFPIGV